MQMQIIIDKFVRSEKSHEFKLNTHDINVLFILSSYMGNKPNCWPSIRTILKDTRIGSLSTVSKSLKKLEKYKILSISRSDKKSHSYKFTPNFLKLLLQICNNNYPRGVTDLYQCVTDLYQGVTDLYPNNIINNIINNIREREEKFTLLSDDFLPNEETHKLVQELIKSGRYESTQMDQSFNKFKLHMKHNKKRAEDWNYELQKWLLNERALH